MWASTKIFGVASLIALTAAEVKEPTAELVVSYSTTEIGALVSAIYPAYDGLDLAQDAIFDVSVYRVAYMSGLAGDLTPGADLQLNLSGLLIIPNRANDLMTVSAFLHEVTTVSDDAPTGAINCTGVTVCVPNPDRSPDAVLGAILAASMGMVTIAPDFIGYGDSVGDWSKYLLAEDYAIATLNMHAAAELLVPMLHSGAGVSSKMVVAGYGEGGYAALAVHRESLNEEWDEAGIIVTASFPSAGPYDLSAEFDRSLAYPWFITQPIYVVYMAFSYSSNMLYGVESLFGGKEAENVVLWFDGSMDPDAITALLFEDEQENNENTFLEVFEKDMLELMVAGTATEFSSALFNNSLNARWASVPSSPIRLCHGSADQDVPYNNSETVMTDLEADGADITLQTLDTCGTHAACAPLCLQHTLLGFQAYTGIEDEPTSGKSTSGHFFSVTHMAVGAVVLVAAVFAAVVYKVKSRKNYYLFEQLP